MRRMGGGLEVNKNRWIEVWNAGRENLALNFRFTRRSLAVIGLAVPILVYKGIVHEFHIQEVLIHRMAGDYIGDDRLKKGFKKRI